MSKPLGWGRVWAAGPPFDASPMPRQGAWYPIVSTGSTRIVLEVKGRRVAVPNDLIEIRKQRPERFTVVYRAVNSSNPVLGTRADLGRIYAVCPVSGTRVRLIGHPRETKCPECGHRGEVAWWETG
ncbi:MAG: hypothetical protein ACREMM_09980 [Gemmatimonadales bacterium]